jgi:hypothetical protein
MNDIGHPEEQRDEGSALVSDMHEFLGKSMTALSPRHHRSATTRRSVRSTRRMAEVMSKSFVVRGFPMLSTSLEQNLLVEPGRFWIPTGPLSTQADTRFQLRDLIFVSRHSASGYLTTGVETRSSVAFAPTNPVRTNAPRASRQVARYRSLFVSRPS